MTNIKEGMAQAVMEAFYKDWTDDEHIDDKIAVINVLREVVNQLQYQSFHHTEDFYQLAADDILELCDEIKDCYKNQIEREKEQIKQNLKVSLKNYD